MGFPQTPEEVKALRSLFGDSCVFCTLEIETEEPKAVNSLLQ